MFECLSAVFKHLFLAVEEIQTLFFPFASKVHKQHISLKLKLKLFKATLKVEEVQL